MKKTIFFFIIVLFSFFLVSSFDAFSLRMKNLNTIEESSLSDNLCRINLISEEDCTNYEYIIIKPTFKGTLDFNATYENGAWVDKKDGKFYYLPNNGLKGSDYFYYLIRNKTTNENSTIGIISFGIDNLAPVANQDYFLYNSSLGKIEGNVSLNDSDANEDILFAKLVRNVSFGILSFFEDGSFNYTTNKVSGVDFFRYFQTDLHMDSEIVYSIFIINNNSAPVANPDNYKAFVNQTLNVSSALGVLSNDLDSDNDILFLKLFENVKNGTLKVYQNGSFVYTPNKDFMGIDYFTYYLTDLDKNSSLVNVTITVEQPGQDGGTGGAGGGGGTVGFVAGGGGTCLTEWRCTEWSSCVNGTQTRVCSYPPNFCAPTSPKPEEVRSCTEIQPINNTQKNEPNQKRNLFSGLLGAVIGGGTTSIVALIILALIITGFIALRIRKRRLLKKSGK